MKTTCALVICVFTLSMIAVGSRSSAQNSDLTKDFLINPNRSFVYLKFDHIGKGIRFGEGEPTTRLWLRIVNNCRVSVVFTTFGVPDGSPKGEQGVMHEVVANAPPEIVIDYSPFDKRIGQVQEPPGKPEEDAMPRGYFSHLASASSISPGEEILFSVPIDHIGKRWHMEIPFHFDLPPGKGPRADHVGGQPNMAIAYSLYDLPTKVQPEVEHYRDN